MNKNYNLKLDLQFRCNNSIMKFNQFDNNTSDFFMRITNGGNLVDIEKALVVLAVIKPSGKVSNQFVEVENGLIYADLKPSMKDEIGTYTAQAMLILEDERVVTDSISYEVEEDKIFSLLNDTVEDTEDFTLLTDMLNRLSTIEISEEQRVINEAERILSEENRKIEESKRVEAELIRQHEEADRAKYDATRESNENIRKQNESIRLANEANRIDEEAKRVDEETKRVEAEQLRKDNYDFMTEDEERRRSEANAHKEAEVLRVQAETNRVNEEAKRRTTEQGRVSAENTRVNNENTRETNELSRKNNEAKRVEAETQRQNRYNSFIADAEANASNFENYTNTAKVKEEERKSNELDRKSQEAKRVSNEVERISNENTRKANEKAREKNETSRQYVFENKVNEVDKKIIEINATKDNFVSSINTKVDNKISELDNAKSDMTNTVSNKVDEVETRFNALTSSQQQDAEVIDARDGETSLKARLDRDIEKAKQVYVNVEGSHISTDSSDGYLKDVEILGNTIQSDSNLADIRSVGDKVEGQELYEIPIVSVGKNLLNIEDTTQEYHGVTFNYSNQVITLSGTCTKNYTTSPLIPITNIMQNGKCYRLSSVGTDTEVVSTIRYMDGANKQWGNKVLWKSSCTDAVVYIQIQNSGKNCDGYKIQLQLEEVPNLDILETPYEPYIEDKLTILSPVQLEKVGDVRDRIIEKDGVFGVEKNIKTVVLNSSNELVIEDNNSEKGLIRFNIPSIKLSGKYNTTEPMAISNLLKVGNRDSIWSYQLGEGFSFYSGDYSNMFGTIRLDRFSSDYAPGDIKQYLLDNNFFMKLPTENSQFIPLPHDQQIKLRAFANKTNISFGCEIEGTIKAQVPKSLGATINTHNEQINNLNKELDRVKKLEESTVSTVTTESDFTTVEQTTNGYFEDVKLEGKTLVVNSDNEVVEPGTEGAILKSVGQDVEEVSVASVNSDETQSDKKRLLYYNEETQAWEKPILREWDSIEKHADGKYYYHQRSGEVVLNGSENWNNDANSSTISPATYRQSIQFDAIDIPSASFNTKTSPNIISDLLPTVTFGDVYSHNHIGISISGTDSIATHIIINNNFTDVTELKQWLQANNVTVVYQLAEEKVYECTNIDLITYANETNYVVSSGAIVPKTTLKVHNNISNVVSLLQKKVSLLESNIKASQEVQDMMILETDMRMLDIELALMEFVPMTLNLGGSDMLRSATYFNFLKNHIINETYEKEYLENVMNKYLATGRINQDEYNELYKMLYPPVYDIELPIEY